MLHEPGANRFLRALRVLLEAERQAALERAEGAEDRESAWDETRVARIHRDIENDIIGSIPDTEE